MRSGNRYCIGGNASVIRKAEKDRQQDKLSRKKSLDEIDKYLTMCYYIHKI